MMRFLAPEDSGTQWKSSVGYGGAISPDGKWLAYESRESGRSEVYVRQLPSGPGKWQISSQGGIQPRWSGDGRELFFRSGVIAGMSTSMTVPVQTEGAFTAGSPRPLSGFATSKAATTMLSCPTASISSVSKSRNERAVRRR